jgi:hypothetical protein
MPPQAEADVVGKVLVAIARFEHDPDLPQERTENQFLAIASHGIC